MRCRRNDITLYKQRQKIRKRIINFNGYGGLAAGYISDVTSTVPVSGTFDETQKKIYNIVLEANSEVMKRAKPGVEILTGLKNLGLSFLQY